MDSFDQKFQLLKLGQNPDAGKLNPKENILISHYDSSYLRLFNISTLKSLGIIKIPNEDISKFDLLFNYQGILLTTHQEKIYVIDVQNWEPLSVLYTELSEKPSSIPKNQYCKSLQCKSLSAEKAYVVTSYSDGTVITFSVEKINNRIEIHTIDKFNMIEMHMLKTDDNNVKEMYGNLSKFKSDYMTKAQFSNHFDGILLSFHECLQFLWIRNYQKNEVMKCIPLNYFPFSLNISDDEHFIAIGSKEGLILFVTRTDESYVSGFNLDIFKGHYDSVDYLKFSHNNRYLFSSSYSEIFVWEIKA
jgi:WD40 repeat protein